MLIEERLVVAKKRHNCDVRMSDSCEGEIAPGDIYIRLYGAADWGDQPYVLPAAELGELGQVATICLDGVGRQSPLPSHALEVGGDGRLEVRICCHRSMVAADRAKVNDRRLDVFGGDRRD